MKGFNPYARRDDTAPVRREESNSLAEILQVVMIAFFVRVVMVKSGVAFISIPFLDPFIHSILKQTGL